MPELYEDDILATAYIVAFLCILFGVILMGVVLYRMLKNPFHYPYFFYEFDVTSKRNVDINDYIDRFLCDNQNWISIVRHEQCIQQWKRESEDLINSSKLKKYRAKQYQAVLDDEKAYRFKTYRIQTRYRQKNYVKTAYRVSVKDEEWAMNWIWMKRRYSQLKEIGFEATLSEYNSKSQRKLMTPTLRRKIMERDHYTCRNCGKYMPDEVGLHIDHIIPVAKGGKSVPSNLRVLCSKCNGRKGARLN